MLVFNVKCWFYFSDHFSTGRVNPRKNKSKISFIVVVGIYKKNESNTGNTLYPYSIGKKSEAVRQQQPDKSVPLSHYEGTKNYTFIFYLVYRFLVYE